MLILLDFRKFFFFFIGFGIVCVSLKVIEVFKYVKFICGYFDWGEYIKCYKLGSYWFYILFV